MKLTDEQKRIFCTLNKEQKDLYFALIEETQKHLYRLPAIFDDIKIGLLNLEISKIMEETKLGTILGQKAASKLQSGHDNTKIVFQETKP